MVAMDEPTVTPAPARLAVPPMLGPFLAVLFAGITLWKPSEWFAPIVGVVVAILAFLPPARPLDRLARAGAVGVTIAAALRHHLYVDQPWAGALLVIVAALLLYLAGDPGRRSWSLPLATVFGVFLVATTGLELRLFSLWPRWLLVVAVAVASTALLYRHREAPETPWDGRGVLGVSVILGELFLGMLLWPTAPAVGGALVALGAGSGLAVQGTSGRTVAFALSTMVALLLLTARWT